MLMPDWYTAKKGKFHLYFASHAGTYIGVAYANALDEDWIISEDSKISLDHFANAYDHIASPDVFIDDREQLLTIYFHARARSKGREQWTFAITFDRDGSVCDVCDDPIAPFYFRLFKYEDRYYGLSKGANLWRSSDRFSAFQPCVDLASGQKINDLWKNNNGDIRHLSVLCQQNVLEVYYTKIGDMPERIFRSLVDLSATDDKHWMLEKTEEILRPETQYEGAFLTPTLSKPGPTKVHENALRDPFIFYFESRRHLFYSVAGEFGIALATLN